MQKQKIQNGVEIIQIVHKYFLFGLLTDLCCPKTYETVQQVGMPGNTLCGSLVSSCFYMNFYLFIFAIL